MKTEDRVYATIRSSSGTALEMVAATLGIQRQAWLFFPESDEALRWRCLDKFFGFSPDAPGVKIRGTK